MESNLAGASRRVAALDLLRGAAVAGMILVTSPGDWDHSYAALRHAAWNGWTLADMVFPTFLFAVGMALALSYPRALDPGATRLRLGGQIVRRALVLVAIGLGLNLLAALAASDLAHVRLPGVLQRIAVAWALAAALLLATAAEAPPGRLRLAPAAVLVASVLLLAGYSALLWLPLPGPGGGRFDPAGNLPARVDRLLFGVRHLWPYGTDASGNVVYDPEGLLSTLPATVNVLLGVLAGWQWRHAPAQAVRRIFACGLLLFAAGLLLDRWLPVNKRLWTASFALLGGGFSAMLLALLALPARSAAMQRLLWPLRVLGGNAILAFVLSGLLSILGGLPLLPAGGARITPQQWGFGIAQRLIADPYLASFACALAVLALVTLLLAPLHARSIHLRV